MCSYDEGTGNAILVTNHRRKLEFQKYLGTTGNTIAKPGYSRGGVVGGPLCFCFSALWIGIAIRHSVFPPARSGISSAAASEQLADAVAHILAGFFSAQFHPFFPAPPSRLSQPNLPYLTTPLHICSVPYRRTSRTNSHPSAINKKFLASHLPNPPANVSEEICGRTHGARNGTVVNPGVRRYRCGNGSRRLSLLSLLAAAAIGRGSAGYAQTVAGRRVCGYDGGCGNHQ